MANVLEDLGSSLTGNIEKAMLVIFDKRQIEQAAQTEGPLTKSVAAAARRVLGGAAGFAQTVPSVAGKKFFSVQFNPQKLTLFADGEQREVSTTEQGGASGAASHPLEASQASLSVPLIFDDTNLQDAFMNEKWNLSASGIGKGAAAAVRVGRGKIFSVRPAVDGLLAAVKNPLTRSILFAWSDFLFHGTLDSVNADYQMFSLSGEPVRAQVTLRISQTVGKETMSAFVNDFSAAFGAAGEWYGGSPAMGKIPGARRSFGNLLGGMSGF